MNLPPAPPGWNKTMDDLFRELETGVRSRLGKPETDWARAYERSLLAEGTRFPRRGDVYEVLEPCQVSYLTAWEAPYTGGGETMLAVGWRLRIAEEPRDPEPIAVYAEAVDYETLEALVVPPADSQASRYRGFYFSVPTATLTTKFRLVEEGAAG